MADVSSSHGGRSRTSTVRTVVFVLETVMIFGLLAVWLLSESVRTSRSLAILFFYSFPSEFLIGLIPHEPVLIYYGMYYPPMVVALVAGVSTVMAEGINYTVFGYLYEMPLFDRMRNASGTTRIIALFHRMPFAAVWIAGFTPVPFFPLRFLVVMGGYSRVRYLLAVFTSRTPRFYILALIGFTLHIPAWMLATLFALMFAVAYVPVLRRLLVRYRKRRQ